MKTLWFLILYFISPLAFANEAVPKVISIKDYNPQQKYNGRVCVVDLYGDLDCKEPPPKPTAETKQAEQKSLESLKPLDPLVPAKNYGYEGSIMFSGLGAYRGVGGAVEFRRGHVAYFGNFNFNMYSPASSEYDSKLELTALGGVSYYYFPRWYAKNKSKKIFDVSVSAALGYNYVTETVAGLDRKSEPIVGFSSQIAYPLSPVMSLKAGINLYQSFSFESVGASGLVGLGFEF